MDNSRIKQMTTQIDEARRQQHINVVRNLITNQNALKARPAKTRDEIDNGRKLRTLKAYEGIIDLVVKGKTEGIDCENLVNHSRTSSLQKIEAAVSNGSHSAVLLQYSDKTKVNRLLVGLTIKRSNLYRDETFVDRNRDHFFTDTGGDRGLLEEHGLPPILDKLNEIFNSLKDGLKYEIQNLKTKNRGIWVIKAVWTPVGFDFSPVYSPVETPTNTYKDILTRPKRVPDEVRMTRPSEPSLPRTKCWADGSDSESDTQEQTTLRVEASVEVTGDLSAPVVNVEVINVSTELGSSEDLED